MDFKIIGTIFTLIVSALGGAHYIGADSTTAHNDNVIVDNSEYNDFHNNIVDQAKSIDNSVEATLNGVGNPSDTMYLINYQLQTTTHDATYTPDERACNERYKTYLKSAYTANCDYVVKSSSLDGDKEVMYRNLANI